MKPPDWTDRVSWLVWPVALVVIQQIWFPAPAGALFAGLILGLITSLVSLGMYLVYRANRVLNFTAGELGLLPAVLSVMLILESGLGWYLGFGIGFAAAAVLGVAVEFLIIRRFFDAPRLVVTVATIGVAQLLGVAALFLPGWWGARVQSQRIDAPFEIDFEIGSRVFNANHVVALVIAPLAMLAVGLLLRSTRLGIAIRAAAELPNRAAMLGIPVKGLQSVVWSVATILGFIALFLRSGIYGLPVGGALGLLLLLRSLAALTLGRLIHLPTIIAASIALGVLQEAVVWNSGSIEAEAKMAAITGVVIVAGLLFRRTRGMRSEIDTSSWQYAGDVRPIPDAYRSIPIVRIGRVVGIAAVGIAFLAFPAVFGTTVVVRMALILLFAITLMSLGVLTGWAGQISLGQLAFSSIGAATSAWLTQRWHWDITLATLAAGTIGALVSLVVGVPALRLRGAYLAVTTLAFAITVSQYFLNPRFFDWLPTGRIERNPIFGVIDWSSSSAIYYVSLITMVLAFVAVRGIRNSRTGRVLIALRDNEAAVESYGVSPVRAKLTAFAISGFLAAFSGSIFVHHQQALVVEDAQFNLLAFSAGVIGGLGSPLGAFLGSLYFNGTFFWLKGAWRILASGIGLLGILLVAPSGLTGLWYDLRDLTLRWLGARRGIVEGDRAEDLVDDAGDTDDSIGQAGVATPSAGADLDATGTADAAVEAATT